MNVNDFFCGAGGMGLGFHQAGFKVAGAWDYDKYAVESYKHNLSKVAEQANIKNLTHADIPDANVWTFGFPCFAPGTLVLTDNGYKKIEDIIKGDRVLTHNNIYKKVVIPMVNEANHLFRVSTLPSEDLLVTEEHPFYVRKKNGKFDEESGKSTKYFDEPAWIKVKDLDTSYFLGIGINQLDEFPPIDLDESPKLFNLVRNDDFWWLLGYILGRGTSIVDSNGAKQLILDCKPQESYEFKGLLKRLSLPCLIVENGKLDKITIQSDVLCEYVSQFQNSLTSDILNLPMTYMQSFIYGYIAASGRVLKSGKHIIRSKNKVISYEIAQCIAKSFKVPYSMNLKKKHHEISFKLAIGVKDEAFYKDGHLWIPITALQKEEYHGPVYNFEVEDDNSYVVQNIIVHNCQDISVAGKRKGMIKGETRSGMFYEIMRLLEEKENNGHSLPDIIMAENVKMVKSLLPEIEAEYNARGYKMYYQLLNSKYWGVAQNRERYFIVGVNKRHSSPFLFPNEQTDFVPPLSQFLQSDVDDKFYIDNEKAEMVIEEARKRVDITGIHPCITPDRVNKRQQGRRAKGDEEEMYTLTAQDIHGVIIDDTYGYGGIRVYDKTCPTLRASRSGLKTIDVLGRLEIKGQDNVRRVYNPNGVAPTLTTSEGGNRQPKVVLFENLDTSKSVVRKLTPREYARLQGFPDEYEQIVSNSQFYKQMGNAVTVNVAKALAETIQEYIREATNEKIRELYPVLCRRE